MQTLKSEQRLSVAAAKKAERDRDAAQALRGYEAEKRAIHANMMRLRALRLADNGEDVPAAKVRLQANSEKAS